MSEEKVPGKLSPIEYQLITDELVSNLPHMIKIFGAQAQHYKARFDALIAAGFDAKQALEIIKARGLE